MSVSFAPGRINLIGEHTDYNHGFVMPVALALGCSVEHRPSVDGLFTVRSTERDDHYSIDPARLHEEKPRGEWTDYIVGVARQLAGLPPMELEIRSTVPAGAGLSSSAALEVSIARALLRASGQQMDDRELALLCQRAENDFVGMPCGIMDQFASVFGRDGSAILLDCRDLSYEYVPLPQDYAIVAVNSMVKHELGQSAYGERVKECAEACRQLGITSLRDANTAMLAKLSGVTLQRARHVVSENDRVQQFAAACREEKWSALGALMYASHASLRDDYAVSCAELDYLVERAAAAPGILGARMTGGGFGGCTVNLVANDQVDAFSAAMKRDYAARFGIEPQVIVNSPA
jgi:galactokinase